MSFFDNTKNFGIVISILSIVCIVSEVIQVLSVIFEFEFIPYVTAPNEIKILIIVASGISDFIILIFALGVARGSYFIRIGRFVDDATSPFGVLTGFLTVYGIANIITSAPVFLLQELTPVGLSALIFPIILSVIMLLMVLFMTDSQRGVLDKLIYIILFIVFILVIISGIISILSSIFEPNFAILVGIVLIIDGLFLIGFLRSPDTREELGM